MEGDHAEQRRTHEQRDRRGRQAPAPAPGAIARLALTDDAQIG
jgi:hypothetical protein